MLGRSRIVVSVDHFPGTFHSGHTLHFFVVVMTYTTNVRIEALVDWKLCGMRDNRMPMLKRLRD